MKKIILATLCLFTGFEIECALSGETSKTHLLRGQDAFQVAMELLPGAEEKERDAQAEKEARALKQLKQRSDDRSERLDTLWAAKERNAQRVRAINRRLQKAVVVHKTSLPAIQEERTPDDDKHDLYKVCNTCFYAGCAMVASYVFVGVTNYYLGSSENL